MKRTLLLTVFSALLLCAATSIAQIPVVSKVVPKVTLGLKVGANFQDLSSVSFKQAYNAGFMGGAFVGLQKRRWGVQVEALVKSAKFTFAQGNSLGSFNTYINTVYLDVPVLLEYKIIPRLWVQAGPQFSDLISAKDNNSKDVASTFKTSDFSGVLGLEARLPVHFVVGARYILGLTNINNNNLPGYTDAWNNRAIQVYLGFRFL